MSWPSLNSSLSLSYGSELMWTYLAISVVTVCVLLKVGVNRTKSFRPFPILGHLPYFALLPRQRLLEWLLAGTDWNEGKSWRLEVPLVGNGWMVEDPRVLKHILSTHHSSFGKGPLAHERMFDLFGYGIILTSGSKWKSQRVAGQKAFTTPKNLDKFVKETLRRHLVVLMRPFEEAATVEKGESQEVGGDSDKSGVAVDFQKVAYEFAMAVFGELAYDTNFSHLSSSFPAPFDRAAVTTESRFFNPFYKITESVLPYGRQFKRDVVEVKRFGRELVGEMRTTIAEEEEGVDLLKDEQDANSEGERDMGMAEKGHRGTLLRELTKEYPREEDKAFLADACLNFLTAGRDTTAQALTWTLYSILHHPAHLQRIEDEIYSLSTATTPSYADLTSSTGPLRFTNAVISESLRLHPPVPLEIQENTGSLPIVLPDGNIVHPGEKVLWSPWVMARSPRIWGEDADSFRPDRWFESTFKEKTAYEWPVFHAGPRNCLGKNLARAELAFSLVHLLRRFEFELDPFAGTARRVFDQGLTGPMKGGLPVRVTRKKLRIPMPISS